MGTEFKIIIDDANESLCKLATNQAFEEAHRLDLMFSDYLSNSEASTLSASSYTNQGNQFQEVSSEFFKILKFCQSLSVKTNGKFDISVGPASRLWRIARFRKTMPKASKIANALSRIGYNKIILHPVESKVCLNQEGMLLDFGSIAKGYAGDQMLLILKKHGLIHSLIDTGGDLVIGQAPRGKTGWRVEIGGDKHPELPTLNLSNCAVATSGDIEQFVTIHGKIYSHIIDPSSGIGINERKQVTVIGESGMVADSMASAALICGPNYSEKILAQYEIESAFFITQQNGFKKLDQYKCKR
ncbi:MAG: FAD:protein FMN transferase [Opitutales bacterium]|nr:FAD:protein FMN transferase [Opitutales bacterium]